MLQAQQELRHVVGRVEDMEAALAALHRSATHRLDDVSRGLETTCGHLGIPPAILRELESLEGQAQGMAEQLDAVQRQLVAARDTAHAAEMRELQERYSGELAELQAALDECRSAARAATLLLCLPASAAHICSCMGPALLGTKLLHCCVCVNTLSGHRCTDPCVMLCRGGAPKADS